MRLRFFAWVLLGHGVLMSQTSANEFSSVGINLSSVTYYGSSWVFVDAVKAASDWIPQRPSGGPWDTGEVLRVDADGWPILGPNQAAGTLMLRSIGDRYPGGDYLCLYDGDGDIEFRFAASIRSQAPGRMIVNVTPSSSGIHMKITRSNPRNRVRNIRLLMPGFHDGTVTFHPLFLERLKHYRVLRFMGWMRTINSEVASWSDRTTTSRFSQAGAGGVALEYMVQLCNAVQADAWFCMPHLADDDYVRRFATLVKQQLHPGARIYVEYSNEVWSQALTQGQWAIQQGLALKLSKHPAEAALYFQVKRSAEMFAIWTRQLGGSVRLRRVLSSQAASPWRIKTILDYYVANHPLRADVFGLAPYFGSRVTRDPARALQMSVGQILAECDKDIDDVGLLLTNHAASATAAGLSLVAYEGGQSLVARSAWREVTQLVNLYHAANRAPAMKELYLKYLQTFERSGGGLMCAFASCGVASKYGSWGVLEYQDQPRSSAPKYDALATFVEEQRPIQFFGVRCNGIGLEVRNRPVIGSQDLAVDFLSTPPAAAALFMIGASRNSWRGISLPLDLGFLGAPGCSLDVGRSVLVPVPVGAGGRGEIALPIPNRAEYLGAAFYCQWHAATPRVNPLGMSTSRAVRFRVSR